MNSTTALKYFSLALQKDKCPVQLDEIGLRLKIEAVCNGMPQNSYFALEKLRGFLKQNEVLKITNHYRYSN